MLIQFHRKATVAALLLFGVVAARAQDVRIGSVSELQAVATEVNGGTSFEGRRLYLDADLDLTDISWTPIGTTTNPFLGTFEGQGHWVTGLEVNIDGSETGDVAGFFGCIGTGGTVRQLGVDGSSVHIRSKSDGDHNCYVGGICGLNMGTIEQCANRATIVGNWSMANLGGIAGANGNIGGGETTATIRNCYNWGEIYTNATFLADQNYIGGIVGNTDGTVLRVYNTGKVAEAVHSGGICGLEGLDATISEAYAEGETMKGFYLDGKLNEEGDYGTWTFSDGLYPELTCFTSTPLTLRDDSDNSSTLATYNGQTCDVTLQGRTLWQDGAWNTLALPFALTTLAGTPLEGATVMGLSEASFADGTLTLNFETAADIISSDGKIVAFRPLIVKWASGDNITDPAFSRVTLTSGLAPQEFDLGDGCTLTFTPTCGPITLSAGDRQKLFLSDANTLYYPTADVTVGSFRAYFTLGGDLRAGDPETQGGIRSFVLNFGETTGIEASVPTPITEVQTRGSYYSLSGQKLSAKPTQKGIYVLNGKKVVIK